MLFDLSGNLFYTITTSTFKVQNLQNVIQKWLSNQNSQYLSVIILGCKCDFCASLQKFVSADSKLLRLLSFETQFPTETLFLPWNKITSSKSIQ